MGNTARNIVNTRNLSKAKYGRGGDTDIRKVDNKDSHVNAYEAFIIDTKGKAGEDYVKQIGSGTINPLTGMPEYQTDPTYEELSGQMGGDFLSDSGYVSENEERLRAVWGNNYEKFMEAFADKGVDIDPMLRQSFKEETAPYFRGTFYDEPFDFLKKERNIATEGLDLSRRTLGDQFTSQYTGAISSANKAIEKSNLAYSGTIQKKLSDQMKALSTTYGTGVEKLDLERREIDTQYEKDVFAEKRRQMDDYYQTAGQVLASQ